MLDDWLDATWKMARLEEQDILGDVLIDFYGLWSMSDALTCKLDYFK